MISELWTDACVLRRQFRAGSATATPADSWSSPSALLLTNTDGTILTLFYRKLREKSSKYRSVSALWWSPWLRDMWSSAWLQPSSCLSWMYFWEKGTNKASSWTRFRNTSETPSTGLWGKTSRNKAFSLIIYFPAKPVGKTGEKMLLTRVNFISR